jgi:hypothetical protein
MSNSQNEEEQQNEFEALAAIFDKDFTGPHVCKTVTATIATTALPAF